MVKHLECRFDDVLNLPRAKAFKLFVDHPSLWWTSPFDGVENQSLEAGIEPFAGGACYEIDNTGQHRVWGMVLSIEEPLFLRLAWQVSQDGNSVADPAAASRVMVNFRDAGDTTRLEIVHSEFLRHGEQGASYMEEVAGPNGWPKIIENLKKAAGRARHL
ncbi:MAG: SRPBCC family protein [Roseibium sp.]